MRVDLVEVSQNLSLIEPFNVRALHPVDGLLEPSVATRLKSHVGRKKAIPLTVASKKADRYTNFSIDESRLLKPIDLGTPAARWHTRRGARSGRGET
jgi:hypothetical protein